MASVAKFRMNEAPRLLAHCSRTQKNSGSHIHKARTELNFNMAYDQHTGLSDYDFVKDRTHQDNVKMMKRDDVKAVCSWAVTMPRELCHEVVDTDGESYYVPNDMDECRDFFQYAYDFFKDKHGEENIVSAYVHMDENVPHMHFTFVPIVKDKDKEHEKVCAKEALADCYGAKFQIELQDYISAQMGIQLNMVKKDTVDYERNVKELKKKTLNDRCNYLTKEISRAEEELERKQRILKMAGMGEQAEKDIDNIETSTSNGFTVMREPDWLQVKPLLKSIKAMRVERKELLQMIKDFEHSNTAKENQTLREQAEQLAKENAKLEKELQNVQRFMQTTRLHDQPIIEIYEEDKRRQAAAHRDDWKESMYNDR